jgi:hypothetical protein
VRTLQHTSKRDIVFAVLRLTTRKLLIWVLDGIEAIKTPEDLRSRLDSLPPMSKRDEAIALFISKSLPQLLRFGLKILAKSAASTLPQLQTGRPKVIPLQRAHDVLDYVSLLHRKGCSWEIAKQRAAERFGCNIRTIERLWSKRESIELDNAPIAVSVDDVINYLGSDAK